MNLTLFIGLLCLLGSIYIWIGSRASQGVETNEEYFLMGRGLTFFPLTLTLLATQLGGGTLLGAAQEAYTKGWWVFFYPLGAAIGLFALGMGFGGRLRALNISTIAEIFEKIYRSTKQRYFASGLSILALFFILVGQGIAIRKFFVVIGMDGPWVFSLFWSILILYTVMGGFKAVVDTDILQALFIMGSLVLVLFTANTSPVEGAQVVTQQLDAVEIPWMGWLLLPLLFMLIEQDMGQRCFAAKNGRVISLASITAGVTLLICSSVAIYLGVSAREAGLSIPGNSSVLVEAVKAFTNPQVAAIFMVAIFMAVISTADSLLCSISSNLACDFFSSNNLSEKRQLWLSRLLTLSTGLGAMGLAFFFDNIVTMLMLSYELSVCVLFVPIVAAIMATNPSKRGATLAMYLGGASFLLFRSVEAPLSKEVVSLMFSTLGYFVGAKLFESEQKLLLQDKC